jgi:hypothetical protein
MGSTSQRLSWDHWSSIPYGGGLLGIFAIIFAMKLRKAGEGDSVSTAGLVTGIVGTACWGVVLVVLLVAAAIP